MKLYDSLDRKRNPRLYDAARSPNADAIWMLAANMELELRDVRSYAELASEALTELLRQVEAFVAENGEADFYTGQAKEVLAKNPFDPLRHETSTKLAQRIRDTAACLQGFEDEPMRGASSRLAMEFNALACEVERMELRHQSCTKDFDSWFKARPAQTPLSYNAVERSLREAWDAALRHQVGRNDTCQWRPEYEDSEPEQALFLHTACGHEWMGDEDGDAPGRWVKFCPFCGKPPRFAHGWPDYENVAGKKP